VNAEKSNGRLGMIRHISSVVVLSGTMAQWLGTRYGGTWQARLGLRTECGQRVNNFKTATGTHSGTVVELIAGFRRCDCGSCILILFCGCALSVTGCKQHEYTCWRARALRGESLMQTDNFGVGVRSKWKQVLNFKMCILNWIAQKLTVKQEFFPYEESCSLEFWGGIHDMLFVGFFSKLLAALWYFCWPAPDNVVGDILIVSLKTLWGRQHVHPLVTLLISATAVASVDHTPSSDIVEIVKWGFNDVTDF
jgi:hypothetical protein